MVGHRCGAAVILLLLASASCGLAQLDENAAIIQTTLLDFRVTGQAASNFTTSTQTAFSDDLRSLLSSYNFMSLSVSDYKVDPLKQLTELVLTSI